MSTVNLAGKLAEKVRAAQGSEIAVPTQVLGDFIQEGERQLEGLFDQIKTGQREITLLKDRITAQGDTIKRLQQQLIESQQQKRK